MYAENREIGCGAIPRAPATIGSALACHCFALDSSICPDAEPEGNTQPSAGHPCH